MRSSIRSRAQYAVQVSYLYASNGLEYLLCLSCIHCVLVLVPRTPRSSLHSYWRAPPNSLGKVENARLFSSSSFLVGEEKRGRCPLFPRLCPLLAGLAWSVSPFPSPCPFRFPPNHACHGSPALSLTVMSLGGHLLALLLALRPFPLRELTIGRCCCSLLHQPTDTPPKHSLSRPSFLSFS